MLSCQRTESVGKLCFNTKKFPPAYCQTYPAQGQFSFGMLLQLEKLG